jgi:hypothetical protein
MCRQSTDLQSRREKLKKSAYMLAAVFFGIIGIVFAWFTYNTEVMLETFTFGSTASELSLTSYYVLDDTDTVPGEADVSSDDEDAVPGEAAVLSDDEDTVLDEAVALSDDTETLRYDADISGLDVEYEYQVISGENGFSVAVNPGQRILFRTEVSNDTMTERNISLSLTGCSYSALLQNAVRIGVWRSDSDGTKVAKEIAVTDEMVTKGTDGDDGYCLESVLLAEDITIPAGNGTSPGTATIDWYIRIDGNEVGNECQDAWLVIGQLQIVTKE